MKHRFSLIAMMLCCALCQATAGQLEENLLDVVEAAQKTIQKKYPDKDSIARKLALEELEKIARGESTDERKIEVIREKYPELPALLDLNSNGIPDEWEKKYKVPPDSTAPGSDQDGDGFTLMQEYRADTDPTDPHSHPKYITQCYVSDVIRRRFSGLELASVDMDGKTGRTDDKRLWTATFNVIRNGKKRKEFVRIDSTKTLAGSNAEFIVEDIEVDEKTQVPVVYLQRLVNGVRTSERIPCRPGQPIYDPVPEVKFTHPLFGEDNRPELVGATFGINLHDEETYKIVSADPDRKTAVVEYIGGKVNGVKVDPGEKNEMFFVPPAPKDLSVKPPQPAKSVSKDAKK